MPFENKHSITFNPERDDEILAMMKKIYPDASDRELREAKANLEQYLKTAWRIAERLEREAQAVFDSLSGTS